jgi:hypothetical protein
MIRQLLPLLVVLGVLHLTADKLSALSIAIGLILGFFTTLFTRSQTVPLDTANKQIEVAVASPKGTSIESVVAATKEAQ